MNIKSLRNMLFLNFDAVLPREDLFAQIVLPMFGQ